jgi:hypothetical protein
MRVGLFFWKGAGGLVGKVRWRANWGTAALSEAGEGECRWTEEEMDSQSNGKLENSHLARVIRASSLYTETCSS